ncbi:Polygalacturonase [Capsicum baccatum]|uniref:Polygalacturonase n=1 Tax=Capsicum baccatum TaxID=33114 RepID=A0A2G2VVV5_CAPBA|nr:Polygalacturonase [Capsicum baccatum]
MVENKVKLIDVSSFGAKGDGNTDDTKAFEQAWQDACSSNTPVNFVVQQNKNYLLKNIHFLGPCKSFISMQIFGTLEASDNMSDYNNDRRHWILFENVENLVVAGGGTINGNGNIWWQNSCKINKNLGGSGSASNIKFQHIDMEGVENPIIIDQNYCDQNDPKIRIQQFK